MEIVSQFLFFLDKGQKKGTECCSYYTSFIKKTKIIFVSSHTECNINFTTASEKKHQEQIKDIMANTSQNRL